MAIGRRSFPSPKKTADLGHEITGRVVEKGASVNQLELGDRVGVPWVALDLRGM